MRKIKYPFYDKDGIVLKDKLEDFKNGYFEEISPQIPNQTEICKEIKKIAPKWDLKKLLTADFSELIEFSKKNNAEKLSVYFKTGADKKGCLYSNIQRKIADFFVSQKININTCFYCNIDFINIFEFDNKKKNHFTLDHVLPKNKYPFLSMSIFNLVPCCYSCNSRFKHKKEFNINKNLPKIIPSATEYNFDELAQFKLKFKENKEKLDLKVELTNLSNIKNVDEYITMFELEGRYQYHQKNAEDLIDKRQKYSNSQIKEIASLTKQSIESLKKDIFGKECFESNNEPFEKYKQDIAKQLGLI